MRFLGVIPFAGTCFCWKGLLRESCIHNNKKKTASTGFTDNQTEIGNLYCNDQVSSLSDEWDTNKNNKF